MNLEQCIANSGDVSLALCKIGEMSQLSGFRKRTLRRYYRIGLLQPEVKLESGRHLYSRHDLFQLERLTMMQMLGLTRSEIKDCLSTEDRQLQNELRLQREILIEKRRRLNRVIYLLEYAEEANRAPQSEDWHHLGSVVEAIQSLRDPQSFKRFYVEGNVRRDASFTSPDENRG